MSFGGVVSAMVTTLKNNKIQKRERKLGNHEYVEGVPIGKPLRFKNQLSKEELIELGEKIKRERRRIFIRDTIYTVVIIITAIIAIFYFAFS